MRRLPIFFMIDVSESMAGENLFKMEEGIASILTALRTDPYALETAYLSVIAFAGKAKTITPMTEIAAFNPPELPLGGGTHLGVALNHLMSEIDCSVVKSSSSQKGDWKPIVFLFTDGVPTDFTKDSVDRWNAQYSNKVNLISISIEGGADHKVLNEISDEVLVFNNDSNESFTRFIQWISKSIGAQSRSVSAENDTTINLAKIDEDILISVEEFEREKPINTNIDERYAVFIGKCSKHKMPYVVKYERKLGNINTRDSNLGEMLQTCVYNFVGIYPVKNSYFELSDGEENNATINSADLVGQPPCPHCFTHYSMAFCSCKKIHCIEGAGENECPWCGKANFYGFSEGDESFEINRGRG